MTLRKKLRIFWALCRQHWHIQTCGECGFQWMAIGPEHPELIRICDACELKALDRMFVYAESEYQRLSKRGVI